MIHMKVNRSGVAGCLLPTVFVSLSVAFIALSVSISAATIDVTRYGAVDPNNGKYDRNPSLAMYDSLVWVFYAKGDDGSTGGVRGPGYNPDNDSYVIWYKVGSLEGLGGEPETRLDLSATNRPVGFDQRDVSAVSFNGSLYVFASAGFGGSDHGVYYYKYDGAWSGPVALATGGGGHVNAVSDADRVYLTFEQGVDATLKTVVFTWDGTTLNGPYTIVNGNGVAKIAKKGDTLYVVSVAPGSSTVSLHSCPASATPSSWTYVSNPITVNGANIWDPSLCVAGNILHALAAPSTAVPDRQWIVQSFSTDNGVTWSPVRTITTGGSGKTDWWEYWPVAYASAEGEGYLLLFTTEGHQGVYGDGMIAGIGTDWQLTHDHSSYIQPAINMAVDGDSVVIDEGTYTGDGNRDLSFLGKAIVVTSESFEEITIIDCESDSLDPHRGFIFENDEDSTSVLSQLIIRNAYAPLDTIVASLGTFIGRFGGGVFCDSAASPHIKDCRFEGCGADVGGGMLALFSPNLKVDGCTFHSNKAGSGGAAVIVYSHADFVNCEFDSNVALLDGASGVQYSFSTGSQTNCTYFRNSTQQGQGGALAITDTSNVSLNGCIFVENEVMSEADGGAIHLRWMAACDLAWCLFQRNSATNNGGAIAAEDRCSIAISHSSFLDNSSGYAGGAIALADSCSLLLNYCRFSQNSSGEGAALKLSWGGEYGWGGCSTLMTNCTFAFNTCSSSGGVIWIQPHADSVVLDKSLVVFNNNCSAFSYDVVPTLRCCDLFGNELGDWTGILADQLGQNGNITDAPRFCNEYPNDLRINVASPCAPDNNSCQQLIGADGVGCYWTCGDVNASGIVNIADVVYLIQYIFAGGPAPNPLASGDVNCNSIVNIADVVYLIQYIFSSGPAPCAGCK